MKILKFAMILVAGGGVLWVMSGSVNADPNNRWNPDYMSKHDAQQYQKHTGRPAPSYGSVMDQAVGGQNTPAPSRPAPNNTWNPGYMDNDAKRQFEKYTGRKYPQ